MTGKTSIANQSDSQRASGKVCSETRQLSFFKPVIQPKLTINQPNDVYEQEADAMAEKVMRMTDKDIVQTKFFKPSVSVAQRKCAHCEEEEKKRMQRKEMKDDAAVVNHHSRMQIQRQEDNRFGGGGASGSWTPAPAPGAKPPSPSPPATAIKAFFHGSTWRIAQTIPGNVQPIGGGDFGQGFYTHHHEDKKVAAERARWEGCRLCQKMSPSERYAGVIQFDVLESEYRSLFPGRKVFNLTSTTQKDYAAQQKKWLDFVSGPHGGREPSPTYDAAHMSWRHQRVDPPPGQDYLLIEGPMYKGVEGLPGSSVPPRSAFDPYAEGTALPQQIVWNYQQAMNVLNDASTTLTQYDAKNNCAPIDPPVKVRPLKATVAEDAKALEAAQIELTGH